MTHRSHIIVALVFICVFGAGVAGFFFWLSSGANDKRTLVIVTRQSVDGVTSQAPVKFKGLNVGHVDSVGFTRHDANKVRIVIKVRDSVPLNQSSHGQIELNTLTLKTPDTSAPPLPGQPPRLALHQSLKEKGMADLDKVGRILDQVQKMTGGDNAKNISATLAQLNRASHKLVRAEQSLQPALAQLPDLTRQLRHTTGNVDQLTKQAIPTIRKTGQAGQQVMRRLNSQILPHLDKLTLQLDDTARQIQTLGAELSSKPQSILTGPPKRRPGPGEPGFKSSDNE